MNYTPFGLQCTSPGIVVMLQTKFTRTGASFKRNALKELRGMPYLKKLVIGMNHIYTYVYNDTFMCQ